MRRVLRVAAFGVLAPVLAIALYLLAAFAGALLPGKGTWEGNPPEVVVGLLRGPIHYDFLLPLADPSTRDAFSFAAEMGLLRLDDPWAEWLVAGWGSEAFYTTAGTYADIAAGAVWQAATGDAAVIRLDLIGPVPADAPEASWLTLSRRRYDALLAGIAGDFTRDVFGAPMPHAAAGFRFSDSFWQAPGRFHLFRTCNQWVAEKLNAADVPFGRWTPTPQSVALSLGHFRRPAVP